jgi:tRNA (adenine57-N1/adenine58-N1)-methyltransferase
MSSFNYGHHTRPGDLAHLVSPSRKLYQVRLQPGGKLQTHRGVIEYDDLIGIPWGSEVSSHQGSAFYLLQPALGDLIKETKRNTQIMYPKDIGYLLVMMGIGPGARVLEAGTGSGSLTTALAWAVGSLGKVYTYEVREEMYNLARKNLTGLGLEDRVVFKLGDIQDGFEETELDALFLDVPNPYDYLPQARLALKGGGGFGCILPTTNQVERLLSVFHYNRFSLPEVCEILLRFYKPVPDRFRPTDRMVAHTGFLVFARAVTHKDADDSSPETEQTQ